VHTDTDVDMVVCVDIVEAEDDVMSMVDDVAGYIPVMNNFDLAVADVCFVE